MLSSLERQVWTSQAAQLFQDKQNFYTANLTNYIRSRNKEIIIRSYGYCMQHVSTHKNLLKSVYGVGHFTTYCLTVIKIFNKKLPEVHENHDFSNNRAAHRKSHNHTITEIMETKC